METHPTRSRPVVLIVDDEDDIREALALRLDASGFAVREAADGHEAFEFLAGRGIDAVVCDVRMPRCDGVSLLKRVRSSLGDAIPFAFVTADAGRDAHDLLLLRSQAVFPKPFDGNAIVLWLRDALWANDAVREDGSAPVYVTLSTGQGSEKFVGRVRSFRDPELLVSVEPRSLAVGSSLLVSLPEPHEGRVARVADNVTAGGRRVGLEVCLVFPPEAVSALEGLTERLGGIRGPR